LRRDLDLAVFVRESVIAIAGEDEWAVKINTSAAARQHASGEDTMGGEDT
jgi:hypothetical protein